MRIKTAAAGGLFLAALAIFQTASASAQDLDDAVIRAKIVEAYRLDPVVPSGAIDIHVTAGLVTLRGTVPDMLTFGRAGLLALRTRGVRQVINDLSVEPPTDLFDQRLALDVRRAFLSADYPSLRGMQIFVNRGVVVLRGKVLTKKDRDDAALIVRGVPGVGEVRNDLVVDAPATAYSTGYRGVTTEGGIPRPVITGSANLPPTDARVRLALQEVLLRDPRVASPKVAVQVSGGRVVLVGTVSNQVAKHAAEQDAWTIPGVIQVVNQLGIEPVEVTRDGEVLTDVLTAVARDPYLGTQKITATMQGGTVFLLGTVDSELERAHAEEVAATVEGVVSVENRLQVRTASGPRVVRPIGDETRRQALPRTERPSLPVPSGSNPNPVPNVNVR